MAVVEIPDFTKGKRTRRGQPLPPEQAPVPFLATVVTRDSIHDFLRSRTSDERDAFLRRLRRRGLLVHEGGRLTQRVRTGRTLASGYAETERCYVFRGCAHLIPRVRRSRDRVIYW